MNRFTISTNKQARERLLIMNGERFTIRHRDRPADLPHEYGFDQWTYTLPTGETYSHPTEAGALLMCLKHLGGGEWSPL